jgi:hypothetical protein
LKGLHNQQKRPWEKSNIFRKKTVVFLGTFLLSLGVWSGFSNLVKAQSNQDVPDELAEIVTDIETAANAKDLDRLMDYYDANYTNEDGLTNNSVRLALKRMWSDYPQLNYDTEIISWEQEGDRLIAETTTKITGTKNNQGIAVSLESNLKSRQYFQNQKLVRQEILAEETIISKGENPPQIQVNVPETVKVGDTYYFDTIVTDPLDGKVLLGAASEERVNGSLYLNPNALELEPLSAGGIFKVVTAPRLSDDHWLSAIIVSRDGVTMVTRRVSIE